MYEDLITRLYAHCNTDRSDAITNEAADALAAQSLRIAVLEDELLCRRKILQKTTKNQLAALAINLFDNIDEANQFDPNELFYHCDKAFLLHLIENFLCAIEQNNGLYTTMPEDELSEVVAKARKLLGRAEE